MEIANLISGFSQQQSRRNAILSENLANYGAQIGDYLANQEYQKQAQAALPVINEQMQSALALASQNKPAEAYSKILDLVTKNPNLLNNPYTLPAFTVGLQVAEKTASAAEKMAMYRMQYGPRKFEVQEEGEETVTPMPSIAQMSDPNFNPLTSTTRTTTRRGGGGGGGRRGGSQFGTLTAQFDSIDSENADNLPTDQDYTTPIDAMDMGGQGGSVDFGWSLYRGYKPDDENIQEFQANFQEYNASSPEEKQKYEAQNRISESEAGENAFEVSSRLFPDIVGIKGPKGSPRVSQIEQNLTPGREGARRTIVIDDPLTKFINDFKEADRVVSGDAILSQIHQEVGGDYSRVTTRRLNLAPSKEQDEYEIFIDGQKVPEVTTAYDGDVAIKFLASKEAELATNKIKLVRRERKAAPAEGEPKERFPEKPQAPQVQPEAAQPPPPGIPAVDWEKLTPAERERIMTERIRGAIGTGVGAVMRGGKAILRGAKAIR